jgi:hypothetical protein
MKTEKKQQITDRHRVYTKSINDSRERVAPRQNAELAQETRPRTSRRRRPLQNIPRQLSTETELPKQKTKKQAESNFPVSPKTRCSQDQKEKSPEIAPNSTPAGSANSASGNQGKKDTFT